MNVLIDVNIVLDVSAGMEAIVTRNPADFVHSPVPVLTPAELLKRLAPPSATPAAPTTGA